MDCHAMSLTTSLPGCGHGLPPHRHPGSQQFSFVQVRVDCRLRRAEFHNQGMFLTVPFSNFSKITFSQLLFTQIAGRDSGFGVTNSKTLVPCCSSRGSVRSSNSVSAEETEREDDEGDAWLVDETTTPFNQISVLELDETANHELAGAYVLKLDSADLAHSIFWSNGKVWSGGCHDVFASLPPLLPEGPIGILGLGAGTVPRLLLHIWPTLHLEGWELDSEVVRVARQYFGLTDLEKKKFSKKAGRLVVHIGDGLGPRATVDGGFAGLMVDIFINGTVCKELAQVSTWRKLKNRLRSGGRIMVNCIPNSHHLLEGSVVSREWDELMYRIVRAMCVVFPGEVSVRELMDGNNVMLLSGELPDAVTWSSTVPDRLADGVHEWRLWDASHPLYHHP